LDGFILLVKLCEIRYEVLDNVHMRQWVDFGVLSGISVYPAQTRKGVLAVDVHGAGTANSFSTGTPEGESWVDLIFYFNQGIQDHRPRLVEIDCVRLESWFLLRLIWVPAINLELFSEHGLFCRYGLPSGRR